MRTTVSFVKEPVGPLMCPARCGDDYDSREQSSHHYRPPFGLDDTETFHHPDAGRTEEESEIGAKEVCQRLDPVWFHYPEPERERQQQHAYDTPGDGYLQQPDDQLAESQKQEQTGELNE